MTGTRIAVRRGPRTTPPAAWMTEGGVALARALWDHGLTTTEIGKRIGTTKHAIVGYAHRNGWPPRPSPIGVRKGEVWQARVPTPRKPEQPHRSRNAPPTRKLPKREVVPGRRETCKPEPLGLPTAAFRGCQWPNGDRPDWRWCGAPTPDGGPYCAVHRKIAYVARGSWRLEEAA